MNSRTSRSVLTRVERNKAQRQEWRSRSNIGWNEGSKERDCAAARRIGRAQVSEYSSQQGEPVEVANVLTFDLPAIISAAELQLSRFNHRFFGSSKGQHLFFLAKSSFFCFLYLYYICLKKNVHEESWNSQSELDYSKRHSRA